MYVAAMKRNQVTRNNQISQTSLEKTWATSSQDFVYERTCTLRARPMCAQREKMDEVPRHEDRHETKEEKKVCKREKDESGNHMEGKKCKRGVLGRICWCVACCEFLIFFVDVQSSMCFPCC